MTALKESFIPKPRPRARIVRQPLAWETYDGLSDADAEGETDDEMGST
jgi:hypothetical protein